MHSAILSQSAANIEQGTSLEMEQDYEFEVTCESTESGIPDGHGTINFRINYVDLEAPVPTILIV